MAHSSKNSREAFTLIEVIVAVFVATILGIAVAAFSRGVLRNSSLLRTSLSMQADIRKTFKNFTAEVRSTAPGWDGSFPVDVASSTTFTFYSNIDDDKYTEMVSYFASGTMLKKGIKKFNVTTGKYDLPETTMVIIDNVNATSGTKIFSYYDKSYDGTEAYSPLPDPVDRSRVRLVKFNISTNQFGKYIKVGEVNTVQVSLRNLKDNY